VARFAIRVCREKRDTFPRKGMVFTVGQRVKCLATRFDDGPDKYGKLYSERHFADTKTEWVYGYVKRKLKQGRNMYNVKFDGDSSQLKCSGSHLEAHSMLDDVSDGSDSSEEDQQEEDDDAEEVAQPEDGDQTEEGADSSTKVPHWIHGAGMSAAEMAAEEATSHLTVEEGYISDAASELGTPAAQDPTYAGGAASVTCHDWEYKKVVNMPDLRGRKGRPVGRFRNLPVNFETTELEIFEELMPVSWMELLGRLRTNAAKNADRNIYTVENVKAWMAITIGAASFKKGTSLWEKETHGLVPPANCGRFLSKDKFRRITRHLSQAPPLAEGETSSDRWRDVSWIIKAYNKRRKEVIIPGWLICVDESMVCWTGNGMPHVSFVPRKPEPLGCELKNTCDATTGCMLFLEIQVLCGHACAATQPLPFGAVAFFLASFLTPL